MFKGIKKKLTANRSSGRNRRLGGGRDLGETPPREPPDRGGTKPISPRQIHPSDRVAPLPYSRRSIERSRTAPMKTGAQEGAVSRFDAQPFYGAQRHTLQGPAYPTSPNICVTGGKIEFVSSACSPISSEASITSSLATAVCPSPKQFSSPKHQTYYSSPRNYRKKEGSSYMTSPKPCKQTSNLNSRPPFSIYSSSEFKNSSPTSSTTSRSSRRKSRPERKRNGYDSKSNSLIHHSLPPRSPDITKPRSATMPVREDCELEVLRQENCEFKNQVVMLQKELSKVETKVNSLQREKFERSQVQEETVKEQLSQYQVAINLLEKLLMEGEIKKRKFQLRNKRLSIENIVDRCNALEQANEQLHQEAQSQRLEYEKCLDNVAHQVVQAIIVQKKQQEECERLSQKVQVLQKQNTNLSSLLANKAKSMSPSYAEQVKAYGVFNQCSQSLPNTLRKIEKKPISKDNNDSESSQSSDDTSQSKSELAVEKCDTACWYDVIKSIHNNDSSNEGSKVMSDQPTSDEPTPSNSVQINRATSSHPVLASHTKSAYAQSSNHQALIVNSLTSCVTSYLPSGPQALCQQPSIGNKVLSKLPHVNQNDKIADGITKDEGYSTMSSDVRTEPKVSVSTIAIVEEEKMRPNDSDGESENPQSPAREQPQYVDGLRIVYDDEESSSDVVLIAIRGDRALMPLKSARRSRSESDLSETSVRAKALLPESNNGDQHSLPYFSINKKNLINLQVKSLINNSISKRARNSRKREDDAHEHSVFHTESNSPSSAYSQAEMEDWSLELSCEDLSTPSILSGHNYPGGSTLEGTRTFELVDQSELSWTGDCDPTLDWQYEKPIGKPWLTNVRTMVSPKSGCSDQPAVWSSIEHLSSCSDVASKCSTDIENFCDQLCKLPELKRLSIASLDNTPDGLNNLMEAISLEDSIQLTDNTALDNVFTRDFYRLVKFESTKSLTESSRSLAPSETSHTLDRPKSAREPCRNFTSVLGFLAEQQKCKRRELLQESFQVESPQSGLNNKRAYTMDPTPSKPKRSTSLNLSNGYVRSKGTLPTVPTVPSPPSRSSSRATLPRHSIQNCSSELEDFPHPPPQVTGPTPKSQPPVPPHRFLSPLLPERLSSRRHESPPVPKRITSRALPTPPPRPMGSTPRPMQPPPPVPEDRQVPPRSTSLADKYKRSNSLQTPAAAKGKARNSCGDLVPNCRNSGSLLIHLKKMAQYEDESNNERSSPEQSPEEVGLGTGWVRVAPFTDFTDTKNRANLLDSMMPSSEAGSSETDEESRHHPQEHLIKTAQRNRRRKKVLRHREDCAPRHDRFDCEERNALNSFHFLDSLSSSSEDPLGPHKLPGSKFSHNLSCLRSSEPCESKVDFNCPTANPSYCFINPSSCMGASPLGRRVSIRSTSPVVTPLINPRPSVVKSSPVRPYVVLRPSTARTANGTPRPTSESSGCPKYSCKKTNPSNSSLKSHLSGSSSGASVSSLKTSTRSEPGKRASDPLNVAYKYSAPLNVTYKPSHVTPSPTKDPKTSPVNPTENTDDASPTKTFERKNSLVYRIKEAFEKSTLSQKDVVKSGFEKGRLKSPNVKAVIEKFSQPINERLPISVFSNKIDINCNRQQDPPLDVTYVVRNKSNNVKSTKERNLPPKSSPPKLKNGHETKYRCEKKPAKIPILSIKLGTKIPVFRDKARLSISDSCAEAFSPLSSDDEEVFRKT